MRQGTATVTHNFLAMAASYYCRTEFMHTYITEICWTNLQTEHFKGGNWSHQSFACNSRCSGSYRQIQVSTHSYGNLTESIWGSIKHKCSLKNQGIHISYCATKMVRTMFFGFAFSKGECIALLYLTETHRRIQPLMLAMFWVAVVMNCDAHIR